MNIAYSTLLVFISGLLFTCVNYSSALPECTKVDNCTCETSDGKQIYIGSLGFQGSEAPRFGYELATRHQWLPWEYAYNPCYPFSDGTDMCKNAVACQRSSDNHSVVFNIGDENSTWVIAHGDYIIRYEHTGEIYRRTTHVTLNCNLSAEEPILERLGDQGAELNYYYILTSKCACPGTCKRPLPTVTPLPVVHELSVGSILCIIFAMLVGAYTVGGVLFMKCVRHAEGVQVIPNYELWSGLPRNIRDGCVFTLSCFKIRGYENVGEGASV